MSKFISDHSPCPQCGTILVPEYNIIKNHYNLEHGRDPFAWEMLKLKMHKNKASSKKKSLMFGKRNRKPK